MAIQVDAKRQEIIHQLPNFLSKKAPKQQVNLIETFAERYYAHCSVNDLEERSPANLYGALFSHWQLIYQREPGEAKVRVFNPCLEQDGWESSHTIIQISHDDIPFLVDSIRMYLNRKDIQMHFAIHFGGLKVIRDDQHKIREILPLGANPPEATSEAPIYFEIDKQTDLKAMDVLRKDIERILADVRATVQDWCSMMTRAKEALYELEKNPPPLDTAEIAESKDFLQWLINNNFIFLGSRDYQSVGEGNNRVLQLVPGSGLGVLRDDAAGTRLRRYADLPTEARKLALSKDILIIAKTNTLSTVHRMAYTDYVGVKRFNAKGELIGERRFIGLYTSTAYNSSPRHIPFLRHKVEKVLEELHFPPNSHNGKEAVHVLETLPRDDLLQAPTQELTDLTLGILQLQERKQVKLFIRKDSYNRYFSCLVYLPREMFNTEISLTAQEILMQALNGKESSFSSYFSDSVLARIHFMVRVNAKSSVEYNVTQIEKELIASMRSWSDELKTQLLQHFDEAKALKFYAKYHQAFPASYMDYYLPSTAIDDIRQIEQLTKDHPLGMLFYQAGSNAQRLKLFHIDSTIALSDVLPTLENMGLRVIGERPHEIIFKEGNIVWINDFDMVHVKNTMINVEKIRNIFQDAFANIWFKNAENDGFNRLVLAAELTWNEVAVLRAYTRYLRQTGFTFSQSYIVAALDNNVEITKDLIALFLLRFTPSKNQNHQNHPDTEELVTKIKKTLTSVSSLDEDRILRRLLEVILATIRTNYFQKTAEGHFKPYISFKFDPAAISDLPLPKPKYEIFVYSPRVEGVHLRGGKVARGGIRWSDRREDFRTEILGLVKAQQVKNAVIVPVGAKGGFFPKQLPVGSDRDAIMNEGIFCYSTYIRGLLDITDNIVNQKIVHPVDVVRYDDDDPYLVVAADKGTATFSDIANQISIEYGFWLNDAFASGGSAGYDHKKMGITARGAWESVKRHFRELDMDPETKDFTVVGIGDMAGDVFGNGMLLSKHIKLIGAFNHQHIFLDPNPNPLESFEERKRLFHLPRSAWSDYDSKFISQGGGVFNRSVKSIPISSEIKKAFAIEEDFLEPNDLIRAMLKAPIDLLWNGGIGTFVKASYETHTDVGDRTNDNIRIHGNELKARVVGEGGNLGLTQLGRIEYSLNGGTLFTDFVDNSAGVDCSDHEVNIKILLNKLVIDGSMTLMERNKLLGEMSDEVAALVLRDNYKQTQMLSLEACVSYQSMDLFRRYMQELEKMGRLNRKLEFLPDEKSLIERQASGKGLTRPEIAILYAYCKMFLKQDILASELPDDVYFEKYLTSAFPQVLCKKYFTQMKEHNLRREIISTQLSNMITDFMGLNFVERMQRETGAPVAFVVRAFVIAEGIFGMEKLWQDIEKLDDIVPMVTQQKMMLHLYSLIRRATRWFLRNRTLDINIEQTIHDFSQPIAELTEQIPHLLIEEDKEALQKEIDTFMAAGVPKKIAINIASCHTLFASLDIVEATRTHQSKLIDVAKIYYLLGTQLQFNWLRDQMNAYSMRDLWDELARSVFRDDLDRIQRQLSVDALSIKTKKGMEGDIEEKVNIWLKRHEHMLGRWKNLIIDIKSTTNPTFITYSVVLRELHGFMHEG